jgi:hypothetical protein
MGYVKGEIAPPPARGLLNLKPDYWQAFHFVQLVKDLCDMRVTSLFHNERRSVYRYATDTVPSSLGVLGTLSVHFN